MFLMLLRRVAAFRTDRAGGLAPIAAIVAIALVLAAGASVDISRAARDRTLLQDIADSAAIAGASQPDPTSATTSATAYVAAALAAMTDKPSVTASYQAASQNTYNSPPSTGVPFTVTLSGTMATSLTAMVTKVLPLNVSATAVTGVGQKVTFTLSNYSSDAADHNVIYGYGYDPTAYSVAKNNLYQYAPALQASNLMLDNHQTYAAGYTKTFYIGVNDIAAFALSNTTGTSQNCYGKANGTNRVYYSHRLDITGKYHDYPTENFNWCGFSNVTNNTDGTQSIDNYQVVTVGVNYANQCYTCLVTTKTTTSQSCTPILLGYCYVNGQWMKPTTITSTTTTGPASQWNTAFTGDGTHGYVYALTASRNPLIVSPLSQSCTAVGGVTYNWDDNGGGSDAGITTITASGDDDDHNDMVFTVTCTTAVKPGNARLTS